MIEMPEEWMRAAEAAIPANGTMREWIAAAIGAVEPLIRADNRIPPDVMREIGNAVRADERHRLRLAVKALYNGDLDPTSRFVYAQVLLLIDAGDSAGA
jgi:hypothetical protein